MVDAPWHRYRIPSTLALADTILPGGATYPGHLDAGRVGGFVLLYVDHGARRYSLSRALLVEEGPVDPPLIIPMAS